MANIKLVRVRDPETLMYLNHEGKFVREYAPADCIFRMRETDGKVTLQHDFERTYLHACGTLKEALEPATGLFERFHCPETFCTYARFSSAPQGTAADSADRLPEVNLLMEETDELPLQMMPIGNYQILSDSQIQELEALGKGGGPLGQYGKKTSQGDQDMADLVKWVGNAPESEQPHMWMNGQLKDGSEVRVCMRGNASITIIRQKTLSAAGKQAWEDYKRDNPEEEWSETVETVIKYTSGNRTFWQNAIFFGEQALVGQLIWQAATIVTKLISKGLTKLFTEIAKRGVMRALTAAEARGLQAAMTQQRWYVKIVSWMASGSRGARFLAGTFNFVVTLVIFIVISYFILPLIFKKQRCSTYLYNFTNRRLQVSTAYLYNVPTTTQDNAPETPYILPEVTGVGRWITVHGIDIEVTDKVVHGIAFDFENDSTFMQGFGALLMAQDAEQTEKVLYAMVSVPWVESNSIGLSTASAPASYKSLYDSMDGQHKQENLTIDESGRKAEVGINALTGSDHLYTAQVNIKSI
ncbi:hypothetical protein [Caenispirillum salinarum]|uniref:hypothetical protein n=1 Tax=Caenispirillum salinarum TaxID=859058 RepID=UPI00384EED9E